MWKDFDFLHEIGTWKRRDCHCLFSYVPLSLLLNSNGNKLIDLVRLAWNYPMTFGLLDYLKTLFGFVDSELMVSGEEESSEILNLDRG